MTVATKVSVYSQVFVPRDYDVLGGLDVDHHSIAATFTDHQSGCNVTASNMIRAMYSDFSRPLRGREQEIL